MKQMSWAERGIRVLLLLAGLTVAHLGVTLFLESNLGWSCRRPVSHTPLPEPAASSPWPAPPETAGLKEPSIRQSVCCLKGYALLGGRLSRRGAVISGAVVLLMTYTGKERHHQYQKRHSRT